MSQVLDNQTASFYGQFVQAAYAMFKNPQSADLLRPEPSGIPPTYELGAWILMSDFLQSTGGTGYKVSFLINHQP
jgi:hypothetical protein